MVKVLMVLLLALKTTEAKMISSALADYEYKDEMLIPK